MQLTNISSAQRSLYMLLGGAIIGLCSQSQRKSIQLRYFRQMGNYFSIIWNYHPAYAYECWLSSGIKG
jgi:hypothetical protein